METASLTNILTVDVEEYFQVGAFDRCIERERWHTYDSRVEGNTVKILRLLEQKGITATFFVLGWIAERHPDLVRRIHAGGHELACHGQDHKLVYEQTPEEFRSETRRAKQAIEDLTGEPVISYRAASYSITEKSLWALSILAEEGFRYDSSIFPVYHDRYGIPSATRSPFRVANCGERELIEFPLSTLPVFGARIPVAGGGYFRIFPYAVTQHSIRRVNRKDGVPFIFYIHPWELDPDQPRIAAPALSRFRHYRNLHKTEARFERLLSEFRFAPLRAVATGLPEIPHVHLGEGTPAW